jgi:acetyltransferase-like isoleucine patch superfamily enzyme
MNPRFINAKHATADAVLISNFIDRDAIIGEGSIVWWYARVFAWAIIGNNVSIGGGTEIARSAVVGNGTRIGANCFVPNKAVIGERVFIGPLVVMCDDKHPMVCAPGTAPQYDAQPPVIGDDVSIGAGSVILPGVTIGEGARIGAGAIVTRDVEPFEHVRGEPARTHALSDGAEEKWRQAK